MPFPPLTTAPARPGGLAPVQFAFPVSQPPGITLLSGCEGTHGTTVTTGNSAAAGGPGQYGSNGWDTVTIGTGGTLVYDTSRSAHGSSCIYAASAGGQTQTQWQAQLGGTQRIYLRTYLFFTAVTTAGTLPLASARTSGAANVLQLGLTTAGLVRVQDSVNAIQVTFTSKIPLGQWFRVEGFCDIASTAWEMFRYDSMDATTATEGHSGSGANFGSASIAMIRFGPGATAGSYWMDDLGASTTGYTGPVTGAAQVAFPGTPLVNPGAVLALPAQGRFGPPGVMFPVSLAAQMRYPSAGTNAVRSAFPATVTTAGNLQDQVSKTSPATVATTGSAQDQVSKTLPATVTTGATLARSVARAFTVAVTTAASLSRQVARTLTATVTTTGSVARSVARALPATITLTPSLARNVGKAFTVTSATAAALGRAIGRIFQATVSTVASLLNKTPHQAAVITIAPGIAAQVAISPAAPAAVTITPAGQDAVQVTITSP